MKHTKGPWVVTYDGIQGANAEVCRHPRGGQTMDAEESANANLISAAPDMLEALELANQYILSIANHPDIHNATALHLELQAIIRKARGES